MFLNHKQLANHDDMFYNGDILFISEPIDVTIDKELRTPTEFIWRGRSYKIGTMLISWQDWKFSGGVSKPDWRQRRHRNYFQVECDDDSIYEIYMDRAIANEPKWFLYRMVDNDIKSNAE